MAGGLLALLDDVALIARQAAASVDDIAGITRIRFNGSPKRFGISATTLSCVAAPAGGSIVYEGCYIIGWARPVRRP